MHDPTSDPTSDRPSDRPRDRASRLTVAAAQLGPIEPTEPRSRTVDRLVTLLHEAADRAARLVVFPEAALGAFFPHWTIADDDLDGWFDPELSDATLEPLRAAARERGVTYSLGFTELVRTPGGTRRYNTAALLAPTGEELGRYRKVHLPGYVDPQPSHPFQNLEKRYFAVGDLGFPTWDVLGTRIGLLICNDRRWPEAFRLLGLQGVELVLIGYNTPSHNPALPESDRLAGFQNHLTMQAGAYHNGTWVVAAAKAGVEAGVHQIGGSCIIAPSGELVALATTEADEVITATIDLELARRYQRRLIDLATNRRPALYGALTQVPG